MMASLTMHLPMLRFGPSFHRLYPWHGMHAPLTIVIGLVLLVKN